MLYKENFVVKARLEEVRFFKPNPYIQLTWIINGSRLPETSDFLAQTVKDAGIWKKRGLSLLFLILQKRGTVPF